MAEVRYLEGYTYGVGVDSASGQARNMAATGTPAAVPSAAGSIVSYEMHEIDSFAQMT
jgi:hypothetical protein